MNALFAMGGYDSVNAYTCHKRLHKTPKDFTKPQKDNRKPRQTIESPEKLYKAPETLHKHIDIRQNPKILDKYLKHLTRVAHNNILT